MEGGRSRRIVVVVEVVWGQLPRKESAGLFYQSKTKPRLQLLDCRRNFMQYLTYMYLVRIYDV